MILNLKNNIIIKYIYILFFNFLYMNNIKKILLSLLIVALVSWGIYAANNITSLTQGVSEWDIITSEYYNNLNWPKSEWKMCKYSWWKSVCLDEMPVVPPQKVNPLYVYSINQWEYSDPSWWNWIWKPWIDKWNELVKLTAEAPWEELRLAHWKEYCTTKKDWNLKDYWSIRNCWREICFYISKDIADPKYKVNWVGFAWFSDADFCWSWAPYVCDYWNWSISCMWLLR